MAKLALTDLSIRRFAPADGSPVYHWDTHTRGLGLRVTRNAKTFVVLVTSGERQSIGRYPVLSLADARTEAKRILAERTLGKRTAPSLTFPTVRERYLDACREKNRPGTVAEYKRLLEHFPFKMKIRDIQKHHVVQRLGRIAAPSERAHALVAAKVFFRWAERQGHVDVSPLGTLQAAPPTQSRDRVLSDAELKVILAATRRVPWPYGAVVQLLLLTGQRRGEIAGLRWEWVDAKERLITLPATITKNRRRTTIPYGNLTADLLKHLPRVGEFLFPAGRSHVRGHVTTTVNAWSKAKRQLDVAIAADLAEKGAPMPIPPWTLHDLRRTFATNLAALGVPVHVTEKLLNHVSGTISGVAAVYNRHAYLDEMRAAVRAWEDKLCRLKA